METEALIGSLVRSGKGEDGQLRGAIGHLSGPVAIAKALYGEIGLTEEEATKEMAESSGLAYATSGEILSSAMVETLAKPEIFDQHGVVPYDIRDGRLRAAAVDPYLPGLAQSLELALGSAVDLAQISLDGMNSVAIALFGSQPAQVFFERQTAQAKAERSSQAPGGDELVSIARLDSSLPTVAELLAVVNEKGASDLHLTAGSKPTIRIDGVLVKIEEAPVLDPVNIRELIYSILTDAQRDRFESARELDASYDIAGLGRFRVNVFRQRGSVGAVMRAIPARIQSLESLGLPKVVENFASIPRGLVLVTGPTGSGKSTTLASIIDVINSTRDCHIMTVEDPIEFLHGHKRALVNQREVGEDTLGFNDALRHVLRQDPDVILVGELRDMETISMALTAAETGHAVFASLHTQDAPQSIDRMIDVFPAHQQSQIRVQLALTLQGVMTQQLLPKAGGKGRVVATEVLVATPAVRNLIREAKVHQIYSAMQAGGAFGMQTMEAALAALVRSRQITPDVASKASSNPEELRRLITSTASMPSAMRRGA